MLLQAQAWLPSCPLPLWERELSWHRPAPGNEAKRHWRSWVPVAHTCTRYYSGGRDQEDHGSSQPREVVHETLSWKILNKNRAGGVAQGEGPEFKPLYHKKKKERERETLMGPWRVFQCRNLERGPGHVVEPQRVHPWIKIKGAFLFRCQNLYLIFLDYLYLFFWSLSTVCFCCFFF
jgi:hypothetical protein